MDNWTKTTFYQSRLFQFSLSADDEDEKTAEKKQMKKLSQVSLSEKEFQVGLGNIGKTANGDGYAFLTLNLAGTGIYSILGVENYPHLQQLDLSNNNLTSLKPLTALKYLTHLNASHNKLKKMADFKAPLALEYLDLSNNEITEMADMHENRFLKKIILNNNSITEIQGLQSNFNLEVLELKYNQISEIRNLDNLNLTELYLFHNTIKKVSGLSRLPKLRILDLSRNKFKRIKGLANLISLRKLYLSDNHISKILHLDSLEGLTLLSDLDLCFNPIQKKRYYRYQVLYKLPQLRNLDGVTITPEESVKAENFYGLEIEDKKQIFLNILPEEEFVDRRINKSEFLDPESDSNEEDLEFVDAYDHDGKLVRRANSHSNQSFRSKSKSGLKEKGMRSTSEVISPHSNASASRSVGFKQFQEYPQGDEVTND